MVKTLRYRSTIKSRPYFYLETKKLAELILQGFNEYEIREKVIHENILQSASITRRKEIAAVIIRRLRELDTFLLHQILHNSVETSKCIVLYSIMKTDRLFYEFMHEIIYEKVLIRNLTLHDSEIDNYFEAKKVQSETVASWQDYTIYKLKQVYKRVLIEAGIAQRENKHYHIIIPMIDPTVREHIQQIEKASFISFIFGGDT